MATGVRGDGGPRDYSLLLAPARAGAPVPEGGHLHQEPGAGKTRVRLQPRAHPKLAQGY